jgi:hypothetical protein
MATQVVAGAVKKETTYTEILPAGADPESKKGKRRVNIWEFLPTISGTDWDPQNGRFQIHLYRYNPQTEKRMALDKLFEAIDPFWVKRNYGGGNFNVLVKEDGQIIYNEDFYVEGEPILAGARSDNGHANGNGNGSNGESAMIQAMRLLTNPEVVKMQFEMMRTAAMESMAMMRQQMPQAQNPLETLRAAKEILMPITSTSQTGSLIETLHVLKELGVIGSPEKKGISEVLEIVNTLKGSGLLGGAEKVNPVASLVSALPSIFDKAVNGLHEFRLKTESDERMARLARGELRPGDPNVITVEPGATQQPQQAPQPVAQPVSQAARPMTPAEEQQVIIKHILRQLVEGIKKPDSTGQEMYMFLNDTWPEVAREMAQFNRETLLVFFKSPQMQMERLGNATLYEVADDPRLPRLLDEFFAAAAEAKKQAGENKPLV